MRISPKFLCCLQAGFLILSGSVAGQTPDLGEKVKEAFAEAREKRFEKAAALAAFGKKLFPYLEKYIDDPSEYVRDFVVSLTRNQTSPEALDILARILKDKERYVGEDAMDAVHNEYSCDQIRTSRYPKEGLKEYLTRRPNSARAVLLLSCFSGDPSIVKLIAAKRKDLGTHGDGGIHHGVPFNLSVEMALAQLGDAQAIMNVRTYIAEADVRRLFFILDNVKFVQNCELRPALVELLNDKRPVYEPVSHTDSVLRVSDLALTALTSTTPTLITRDQYKKRQYTDEELKSAYRDLKARLEKDK
jgi:hypothetical protein